jgi:uncharacterized membrane protein YoaK (UPF0700 family)
VNQRHWYLQAGLLTIVAGIADAVGYLTMGGIFAANMTGNTVLAGISVADGHYEMAVLRFIPLIAFFLGAMLARLLLHFFHKPTVPLLIEAAVLASIGVLPVGQESGLMIAALAMGLQASAVTRFGSTAISTVVVTSTLARVAEATLDRMWRAEKPPLPPVSTPRLLTLTWIGYFAGACAGALMLHVIAQPLLIPALLLVIVVFL